MGAGGGGKEGKYYSASHNKHDSCKESWEDTVNRLKQLHETNVHEEPTTTMQQDKYLTCMV